MTHIVIVNGFPRVGKDTLIEEMSRLLGTQNKTSLNYSMISATKAMLSTHPLIDEVWLNAKSELARKLLADTHRVLLTHTDAPINALIKVARKFNPDVLFTCCREPDTILRLQNAIALNHMACTTLLVLRDDHAPPVTEADRNVLNFDYDIVVSNDSPLAFMPVLASEVLAKAGLIERPFLTQELAKLSSQPQGDPAQ